MEIVLENNESYFKNYKTTNFLIQNKTLSSRVHKYSNYNAIYKLL